MSYLKELKKRVLKQQLAEYLLLVLIPPFPELETAVAATLCTLYRCSSQAH